jgi:uncharacterized protein
MSHIERHTPGTISWVDLMTPDPEGARKFYGSLFGWTFDVGPAEVGFYALCNRDGRRAAGIGKLPEGSPAPSSWNVYFAVEDADATVARIKEKGGEVMMGPIDVMQEGRFAFALHPHNGAFGIWQARRNTGVTIVDEPGATCWRELATRDAAKATSFLADVFGLEPRKLEAPGVEYTTLHKGPETACGVMQMDAAQWPAEIPTHWMTYFAVANVDEAAPQVEALGGKVRVPPFDIPYGRTSLVCDPWGATFHIMTLAAPAK